MTRRVIFIALFSVLLSCLVASIDRPRSSNLVLERAAADAESVVRRVAERGVGVLVEPQSRAELLAIGGQSPMFALLGAWSKLSIGRVGLLNEELAARLPWVVVASLAPAAIYASLVRSWGTMRPLFAVAWLLALPGWVLACARGSAAASLVGAAIVVYALYLRSLPRWHSERARRPQTWTALSALALAIGLAMTRAALCALLVLYVDFSLRHRALAERARQRGLVLMPNALVVSLAIAPVAFVALNPALYGVPASAIVAEVFAPIEAQSFSAWEFVLPALAVAGAELTRSVCLRHAPARFATLAQGAVIALVAAVSVVSYG